MDSKKNIESESHTETVPEKKEKEFKPFSLTVHCVAKGNIGGGTIVKTATSKTSYTKTYFDRNGKEVKTKVINLPLNFNGKRFETTYDLFNEFRATAKA